MPLPQGAAPGPLQPPEPVTGAAEGDLLGFWQTLDFGGGGGDVPPDAPGQVPDMRRAPRGEVPGASNGGSALGTHLSTSINWSGAMLRARHGLRFNAVAARWCIPQATRPQGESLPSPQPDLPPRQRGGAKGGGYALPDSWRCSIWVGLDGHRLASNSLPQIGTTVKVSVKPDGDVETKAYAWVQWYVRGKQYDEVVLQKDGAPFKVEPGQMVTAWLRLLDRRRVLFRMCNADGEVASVIWRSGGDDAAFQGERKAHEKAAPVEGAAAAFVVERPAVMPAPGAANRGFELYPLPEFGAVEFETCAASVHDPDRDGFGVARRIQGLRGAEVIRLIRQSADPFRVRSYLRPELNGAKTGMRVHYWPPPVPDPTTPVA
jgi:hypothetical protein